MFRLRGEGWLGGRWWYPQIVSVTGGRVVHVEANDLGKWLQQARKQRGMTQAEAAKIIDVARTTLIAIEKGDRRLKSSEFIKLARAYGKNASDFVQPIPVIESFDVQFRSALHRSDAEKEAIQPIILQFQELCQNYLELEQIMDSPLPRHYPPEYQIEDILPIDITAESIANAERQRLGLGDKPVPLLRDILAQEVGIRIFYLPMPYQSKCLGMYGYNEKMGCCIAINANHTKERQLWSLAHSYLHFLAHRHKPVINYVDQCQGMPRSEQLAESFPKYFLMPTSSLLKQYNDLYKTHSKFTPTHLITLAHYYGVSVQALIHRLEGMGLLPFGTYKRLKDRGLKVKEARQDSGLRDTYQNNELTPVHYQHLAIEAYDQGIITEGRFTSFLGINRLESRRITAILHEQSINQGSFVGILVKR